MSDLLILAVEEAIPADHPAAWLAVPLGLLFLSGSVYVLLWSNYGAKKAAGIYGVAFFGFSFLLGVFWWFGGPGIPPALGITHLPGQTSDHYTERWYAFEAGSERAGFFSAPEGGAEFVDVERYLGVEGRDPDAISSDPAFANLSGSVSQAVDGMREQFLPVDENNVPRIGVTRLQDYEADAAAQRPDGAVGRAQPFYSAVDVGDPSLTDDPQTGVRIARQTFQAVATFTDADGIPLEPVPVGPEVEWYAFFDPGAASFPSMLWTLASLVFLLLSMLWLDRLEQREKALAQDVVEVPEDLAVPIAQ